jgi:hypothetical protein
VEYDGYKNVPLCDEHYNQYLELSKKYTHVHKCDERVANFLIMKHHYALVIMKLNKVMYNDIANIISSFCFVKKVKCIGHMIPRKYNCDNCSYVEQSIDHFSLMHLSLPAACRNVNILRFFQSFPVAFSLKI